MSGENVEIMRAAFEAWDRDDLQGVLNAFDEEVVIRPLIGPEWRGPEGVLGMAADWVEGFSEWKMEAEEYLDAGDMVVVRVRQEGRGEESGTPVTAVYWFAYTLRDGKITRLDMYADEAQAREAAGLSP
jgi:ketosteroid isomerase-like protein